MSGAPHLLQFADVGFPFRGISFASPGRRFEVRQAFVPALTTSNPLGAFAAEVPTPLHLTPPGCYLALVANNCYKCGAEVEDGRPFCPQCKAPQIRVVSSATEPGTEPLPPGTPAEVQPPAEPIQPPGASFPFPPVPTGQPPDPPNRIRYRHVVPGALILGILAAIGSIAQFPPLLLLCIVAGGGIAVAIYHRRAHPGHLRPGMGFRIGAVAGAMGFVFNLLLNLISLLTPTGRGLLREYVKKSMDNALASNPDPAQAEQIRKISEQLNTPAGLAILFIVAMIIGGVLLIILSGFGGSIGAYLFGKHEHESH